MKKKHTQKLLKDFPHQFSYYHDHTKPMMPMVFGFECGDGWYEIIYNLTKKLSEVSPETRVLQVKEKFAGLRYYVDTCNDEGYALIDEAEDMSFKTCEVCGSTENVKVRGDYWIQTRCEKCKDISARDIR